MARPCFGRFGHSDYFVFGDRSAEATAGSALLRIPCTAPFARAEMERNCGSPALAGLVITPTLSIRKPDSTNASGRGGAWDAK